MQPDVTISFKLEDRDIPELNEATREKAIRWMKTAWDNMPINSWDWQAT